jgi:hypothetical protein
MGKRRWLAAGSSLLAAAIGLVGAATAASASTTSPVVGYTYIDGNTATANTIDGFARHADGTRVARGQSGDVTMTGIDARAPARNRAAR